MSGATRVRGTNLGDPDTRPVLRPAANNAPLVSNRKVASKPSKKLEKPNQELDSKEKKGITSPPLSEKPTSVSVILKRQEVMLGSNLAMNGSCSSDASSSDSSQSRASSGRTVIGRRSGVLGRKKQCGTKTVVVSVGMEKVEKGSNDAGSEGNSDDFWVKKRCSWVTANTDPSYAAFHDDEWGVPVHDDKKLFELLCLSGALAELTWPTILSKRHIFREVFLDFDPPAVANLNEKKLVAPGSSAGSLLSEQKLRAIIENARQICKVIEECGSFNKYIWNFVNHKPVVSQFRYPRQVPAKTPKSEFISKDLVRRGFRSVGPTVVYSFMQVAGLTNDHLISCFRFNECMAEAETGVREKDAAQSKAEMKKDDETDLGLSTVIAKLSIS